MPDITVTFTEQHQNCLLQVCDAALKFGGLSANNAVLPLLALVQQQRAPQPGNGNGLRPPAPTAIKVESATRPE
jgi:hypothetical protein